MNHELESMGEYGTFSRELRRDRGNRSNELDAGSHRLETYRPNFLRRSADRHRSALPVRAQLQIVLDFEIPQDFATVAGKPVSGLNR
jgi:hypothetical protein